MVGPDSSYSLLEIHICWNVDSEERMEPPIHTEYLRSGGATHTCIARVPIETLRFRGRKRVAATLKHYIQEAAAALALAKMPGAARAAAEALERFYPGGPPCPACPWSDLCSRARQGRALLAWKLWREAARSDAAAARGGGGGGGRAGARGKTG